MWKSSLIVLAISYITVSATANIDGYVHPHYTYSCEEDKTIVVRGIQKNAKVWIEDGDCDKTEIIVPETSEISINESCLTNYTTKTKGVEIKIQINDIYHSGHAPAPPPPGQSIRKSQSKHPTPSKSQKLLNSAINRNLRNASPLPSNTFTTSLPSTTFTTSLPSTTFTTSLPSTTFTTSSPSTTSTISPSSTTSTPSLIGGGGYHTFKLTCDEIPIDGVFRVAERQMNLKDTDEKTGEIFDVSNVKMTFRKTSNINSEELTKIYTGDGFFMFLQYTGRADYVVMPNNCSAIAGNNVDLSVLWTNKSRVYLWDNKDCLSASAKNQVLMENFIFDDTQRISRAKMYGFHFLNSTDISIICDVTVCAEFSGGCDKQNVTHCTHFGRKRRNALDMNSNMDLRNDIDQYTVKRTMVKRSSRKGSEASTTVKNIIRVYDAINMISDDGVRNTPLFTMYVIFLWVKFVI